MDEVLLARVAAANREFANLISVFSETSSTTKQSTGDWSAKAILAHIIAWQNEALAILTAVRAGTYQHREYDFDQFNAAAVAQCQDRSWAALKQDLTTAQSSLLPMARSLTDEQWQNTVVADWLTESTSEHYKEHEPVLRQLAG